MNIIRSILLFTSIVQVSCNFVDREEIRSVIRKGGNIKRSAEHERIISEKRRNCEGEYEYYSCYLKVLKNFSSFFERLMYFVGDVEYVIEICTEDSYKINRKRLIEAVRKRLSQMETKFEEEHHSNSYNVIWQAVLQKKDEDENLFDVKAARDVMKHLTDEYDVISRCIGEFLEFCGEHYAGRFHNIHQTFFNNIMRDTDNTMKNLNINGSNISIIRIPYSDDPTSIGVGHDQEPAKSYNRYHWFKGNLTGEKYDDFKIYQINWTLYYGNADKTVEYTIPLIKMNQEDNTYGKNHLNASFLAGTYQTFLIWLKSVYDNHPLASSCVIGATVFSVAATGLYYLWQYCRVKSYKKRRGYEPPEKNI